MEIDAAQKPDLAGPFADNDSSRKECFGIRPQGSLDRVVSSDLRDDVRPRLAPYHVHLIAIQLTDGDRRVRCHENLQRVA